MDGEKFDDLLKRICTTRLTRFDALRGLVAGAAAALTGTSLASDEATARKGGAKKKGGAKEGRGGQARDVRAATETTNTRCACTDDLSPKQCPAQSGIEYTCKLCPGIKRGSVQVACNGDTPSCFCQSKECVVGKTTYKKGQAVKVCAPKPCPTADSCDDDNPCTEDKCVNGYCVHKPVVCPPSDDKCEEVYCDPEKGCKTRPVVCEPRNKCETATCEPDKGCKYTPIVCDDGDPCTINSCDPDKGCKTRPVVCEPENKCQKNCVCVPKADGTHECKCERVVCDDDDPCTIDRCNPDTGQCEYKPVDCDDDDACTVDTCVPKKDGGYECKHDQIVCDPDPDDLCQVCICKSKTGQCECTPKVCDDGDVCTVDRCNPKTGQCEYKPVECEPTDGCEENCRCITKKDGTHECKCDPVVCEPENECQKNCVCVPKKDGTHECKCDNICDEGCTPGYWKNHPESWVGFSSDLSVEDVFDVPDSLGVDDATLSEALDFGGGDGLGGAARILLRAAVAALLNAAHPGVDYPLTTAEIIADVNAALASGDRDAMLDLATELDNANNAGCPLN